MNVLFEIGHPAHVHFFRDAIEKLPTLGHSVHVVSRNKDITHALLESAGIDYECYSTPARGLAGMGRELVQRWRKTGGALKEKEIHLAVSISGITTSLPARLRGVRNVVFTDTEDATLSNRLAFPFADSIFTPEFFLKNLGRKHRRYLGLHELAYLQEFDVQAAAQTRAELGLPAQYFFLRVVANTALHDRSIQGLTNAQLEQLVSQLRSEGEVILSSEAKLPETLESYRRRFPLEKVHAVLAGARAFLGESPTMAVESSLLGTPAFLISQRSPKLGNMVCLERDYSLLCNFPDWNRFDLRRSLRSHPKPSWSQRAADFRGRAIAMRPFILQTLLEHL